MKKMKCFVLLMVVLAFALVVFGCGKPPEAEQKAALAAKDAAVAAGADKYAVADLDEANKLWEAAEAQVKDKKYDEAKKGYVDAKAAFEKAAGAVEAGKKALATSHGCRDRNRAAWKTLQAVVKKAEKALKDKKADWEADAQSFEEG
jgi:hypothetical protein